MLHAYGVHVITRLFIAGLLALPFSLGCNEDDGDKSCEFQGMIYEDGEEFLYGCNGCKCNPSGSGPGTKLGVGCTLGGCPPVCSGTLGACELNSHQDCPELFPGIDTECTIEEAAICYRCGGNSESVAGAAHCESGRWKYADAICEIENYSCEYQGMTYLDGEEFSLDACNSCKCNPSGTGPGAQLGVECTAIACPQVCSGTLGICELNSDQSCPAEFPRDNSECSVETATCYKCGFSELDALAESASCVSGLWKIGDVACGS